MPIETLSARVAGDLPQVLAEPALVFLGCVGVAAAVVVVVLWRWHRAVATMPARGVIEDLLAGVEEAFALDHAAARVRFERVLRIEPENPIARLLLAQALLGQGEVDRAHEEQRVVRSSLGFAPRRCDAIGATALLAAGRAGEAARLLAGQNTDSALLRLRLRAELAAGDRAAAVATAARVAALATPGERAEAERVLGQLRRLAKGEDPDPSLGFACRQCALAVRRPSLACPYCGAQDGIHAREAELGAPLVGASVVADEIEETPAHLQRLLGAALRGDAGARADLVALGPVAVPLAWRCALAQPDARPAVVGLFVAMGPDVLPALLREFASVRGDAGAMPPGPGDALEVLGEIAARLGRAALPTFAELVPSDVPALRKLVIDYFIGLADPAELVAVFEHYPPVEVLHRLNAAPRARLQRFLAALPAAGFVVDVLLVHPMFHRDEDLLLAAAEVPAKDALLAILLRRGAHAQLAQRALQMLDDPASATTAERFLAAAGAVVTEPLLAAYLDLDRAPAARARMRLLLSALGPALVPSLCQCFGGAPARLDQEVVELLVALGVPAIGAVRSAYERRNLFERVGGRLVRRYNHPRNLLIKVLARIGGPVARRTLQELRADEVDANLKLRLEQALHTLADGTRDSAGGARADRAGEGMVG